MKVLCVKIDDELAEQLDLASLALDETKSEIVREALRTYLRLVLRVIETRACIKPRRIQLS